MCVTESFCCTAESNPLYIICGMVQLLSCVRLFATPRTAARQASLSITISWSLLKCMSIESVMPPNHLILCRPLLFLPSISPSIRVFSNHQLYFHKKCKKKKKKKKSVLLSQFYIGSSKSWAGWRTFQTSLSVRGSVGLETGPLVP